MFEAYTYEVLLEDVLNNAPDNIDTRQGSIFYDAVAAIVMKVAKLYTDLDLVFDLVMIDTATGEYLDLKAAEYGLTRQSAAAACYYVTFEGTTPDVGERFYTDGLYFVLCEDDNGVLYLECETAGIAGNNVYSGTAAIPVNNITGLTAATFGEIYSYGTDEETDDSLRTRVQEKIEGPAENGNKQHYKTWCESVDGVGRARIFPLWNGPNTVKGVLISSLGLPCSNSIVEAVQEYIDPATKGYTTEVDGITYVVGDGLGEGVANLGAHFTAVAAQACNIKVEFGAEISASATQDSVQAEAEAALTEYFKELALETGDDDEIVVRLSAVGAILSGLSSLLDYSDLTINGGTENIAVREDGVPVLEEVAVNVL